MEGENLKTVHSKDTRQEQMGEIQVQGDGGAATDFAEHGKLGATWLQGYFPWAVSHPADPWEAQHQGTAWTKEPGSGWGLKVGE